MVDHKNYYDDNAENQNQHTATKRSISPLKRKDIIDGKSQDPEKFISSSTTYFDTETPLIHPIIQNNPLELIDDDHDAVFQDPLNTTNTSPISDEDESVMDIHNLHPKAGLFGLTNLGNTCFMNSALQCLTHTHPLNIYFLQNKYVDEINYRNPLGMHGYIAEAYGRLVKLLWPTIDSQPDQSSSIFSRSTSSIIPREFKSVISRFAPQFAGYQQHDSQELLSFLLDGLHEDLNRIKKKPYIEMKDHHGRPDEQISVESWENHKKRNDSIIVDLFQGQFRSTLVCPECQYVSVTFDPFMYLSLPIPSTKKSFFLPFVSQIHNNPPENIKILLIPRITILDVKEEIATTKNISRSNIVIAMIVNNEFQGTLSDYRPLHSIPSTSCLVAYEIPHLDDEQTHAWITFETPIENDQDEDDIDVLMNIEPSNTKESKIRFFSYPRLFSIPLSFSNYESMYDHLSHLFRQSLFPTLPSYNDQDDVPFSILIPTNNVNSRTNEVIQFSSPTSPYFLSAIHLETVWKSLLIESTPIRTRQRAVYPLLDYSLEDDVAVTSDNQETLTLFDCLELFSKKEKLGSEDPWYCPRCKEHRQASKKMDIWKLPSNILVVHLKRFSFSRIYRDKIDISIEFPIKGLDLSQIVCGPDKEKGCIYDLYAISNHFGGLGGGHCK